MALAAASPFSRERCHALLSEPPCLVLLKKTAVNAVMRYFPKLRVQILLKKTANDLPSIQLVQVRYRILRIVQPPLPAENKALAMSQYKCRPQCRIEAQGDTDSAYYCCMVRLVTWYGRCLLAALVPNRRCDQVVVALSLSGRLYQDQILIRCIVNIFIRSLMVNIQINATSNQNKRRD